METAETLKSFYDEWLSTQKQFTKNWLDSAQTLQQTMSGTAQENQERAGQYYRQWTEQQQHVYRNWMDLMGRFQQAMGANGGSAAIPSFQIPTDATQMREALENQMKMYWNLWNPQAQQNPFTAFQQPWQQAMQAFQTQQQGFQQFQQLRSDAMGRVFALYDTWNGMANTWYQTAVKNQEEFGKQLNNPNYKQFLQNALGSTDSYVKLLEFWQPIYKKMQEKTLTPEALQELVSPARYKEVMDRAFEFVSPESLQEFYNHTARVAESLNGTAQNTLKRYNELMQRNTQLLPELMAGDPQAAMKLYESMYEAYQKNMDPALKSVMGGRDAELASLMKEIGGQFNNYTQTLAKYQYRVYVTGQKAMEKVAKDYYETFEKTGEARSFTDFYKAWSDVNQQAFQEVFRTEEFNQLQHDLAGISQTVKGQLGKVVELFLADYPVVPRSEMEQLHQTVHELKAQVASLQAAVQQAKAGATPSTPVPDLVVESNGRKPAAKK